MLKRLLAVALFALAISTAQPAHASTVAVGLDCANYGYYNGFSRIGCSPYIVGATGTLTAVWTVSRPGYSYTVTNNGEDLIFNCVVGTYYAVSLTVTDSVGATGTGTGGRRCSAAAD